MKTYVKPELYYENFELSEHIAGACADASKTVMNQYAVSGTCNAFNGQKVFSDTPVCQWRETGWPNEGNLRNFEGWQILSCKEMMSLGSFFGS